MKISILTLFPNLFDGFLTESIIKRAIEKKKVEIEIINFRDFSNSNNNQVDDTPYGGGAGMVLMCQPIFDAIESIKTSDSIVIMMSPDGIKYNQKYAKKMLDYKHIILLCGHYEGFDERIKSIVDMEVSIGDFVLTGGEIPAMAITDSVVRLIEGVISSDSLVSESFEDDLLDFPVYTKPANFRGLTVPDVLLSGDHKKIKEWRYNARIEKTKAKRKDIMRVMDDESSISKE
ncbi:MAG: tRNA (guanosine(37)-N1)-methyltransferase TrmD [Bacilli bacterium]|nr:tRNA (guanosine(37)-N1)-methyltransferase TrmD [Bacilli bacterium]